MMGSAGRGASFVAILALVPLAGQTAQQPRSVATTDGFDAYVRGDFDRVADAARQMRDPVAFSRDLQRQAVMWIEADGSSQIPHRQMIVASTVLEYALAMSPRNADAAKAVELLQWACEMVRNTSTRSEVEHLWHRTALAALQRIVILDLFPGWRDPVNQIVRSHLRHGQSRFPDDPAWGLADAVITESSIWPLTPSVSRPFNKAEVQSSIRAYEKLLADAAVGAEANIRTAYLKFRSRPQDADAALRHLTQAEQSTRDVRLLYLAAFIRGQIFEQRADVDEATAAYEAALAHWQDGSSAATALAAIRFRQDRRPEALGFANVAIRPDRRDDPWQHYSQGAYHLEDLLEHLRRSQR
jgi:tetratricopeptide (TPR) repeat protein